MTILSVENELHQKMNKHMLAAISHTKQFMCSINALNAMNCSATADSTP